MSRVGSAAPTGVGGIDDVPIPGKLGTAEMIGVLSPGAGSNERGFAAGGSSSSESVSEIPGGSSLSRSFGGICVPTNDSSLESPRPRIPWLEFMFDAGLGAEGGGEVYEKGVFGFGSEVVVGFNGVTGLVESVPGGRFG